jgi:hypothetical protein
VHPQHCVAAGQCATVYEIKTVSSFAFNASSPGRFGGDLTVHGVTRTVQG